MKAKSSIAAGLFITVLLAVGVTGLYLYGQKKMIRDSVNQFQAAKSLYERSEWSKAEHVFTEIAQKYPRSDIVPESRYYVAMIMQAGGRYSEALEKWQALAQIETPHHADEIDYYMGRCMEELDRLSEAASKYAAVTARRQTGEMASLAKLGLGRVAEAEDQPEKARMRYEEAMAAGTSPETRALAEQLLGNLNLNMFLHPKASDLKEAYLIRPGDSMVSIALRKNTTVDLMCRINGISNPANIRPNKRILIPKPDFSIHIDKSDFKLTLFNNGDFFKSYRVGLGKHGCTPVGEFIVDDKMKNPTWYSDNGPIPPGDPGNELGTRWMRLKPLTPGIGTSYGIHGTIDPSTVGWESSQGCPRLYPKEAEELYMLIPIGTPVRIEE